jgi:hypothetical protein
MATAYAHVLTRFSLKHFPHPQVATPKPRDDVAREPFIPPLARKKLEAKRRLIHKKVEMERRNEMEDEEEEEGEFQGQADAKWIVIRGSLKGHNDTPCGRPTPGRPGGWSSLRHIWWF